MSLSRRDLIKGLGAFSFLSTQGYLLLVEAITHAIINKAHAQSAAARNYLVFLHGGAPPRWSYDQFLTPNTRVVNGQENAEFIPHPVVKNVLKNSSGYQTYYTASNNDTTYETVDNPIPYIDGDGVSRGLYLPRLWDVSLPEWNGTQAVFDNSNPVLMRSLCNNTMIIRGYHMDADFGHGRGPFFVPQAQTDRPSISGLVSDLALSNGVLIPAVALTDSPSRPLGYRSFAAKISIASAGGSGNKASDILAPFFRTNAVVDSNAANRQILDAAINQALQNVEAYSEGLNPNAKALFNDNRAVDEIVSKLRGTNLIAEYTTLQRKYSQLVFASSIQFPGLIGELKINLNGSGQYSIPYATDNYSDKFSLAEIFIKNNLSSSFTFFCGGTAAPGSYVGRANNAFSSQNDEHNVSDRQLSFLAHNWKFRGFMACVNEFKKSLPSQVWRNTVLQYGAEYARSPNRSSGGSDHAINACVTTVISGAIDSFLPLGNAFRTHNLDPNHSNYGSYGVGAPVNLRGYGSMRVTNEMVSNSVLTLLGIESPFRDKYTLIRFDGSSFKPNIDYPKTVERS
jgi:hypothetical protein